MKSIWSWACCVYCTNGNSYTSKRTFCVVAVCLCIFVSKNNNKNHIPPRSPYETNKYWQCWKWTEKKFILRATLCVPSVYEFIFGVPLTADQKSFSCLPDTDNSYSLGRYVCTHTVNDSYHLTPFDIVIPHIYRGQHSSVCWILIFSLHSLDCPSVCLSPSHPRRLYPRTLLFVLFQFLLFGWLWNFRVFRSQSAAFNSLLLLWILNRIHVSRHIFVSAWVL